MSRLWGFLKGATTPPPTTLADEVPAGADRFARAAKSRGFSLDAAVEDAGRAPDDQRERLLSDAASHIGEHVRAIAGGEWIEDEAWGVTLGGIGGIASGRFFPLPTIEKKIALGARFSLDAFLATLPARLEAERAKAHPCGEAPQDAEWIGKSGADALDFVAAQEQAFRAFWRQRFGGELPLSLLGMRELDGFLRSHYLLSFIEDTRLVQAGFAIGEVGRGLFGGEWDFRAATSIEKVALRFPELDYYPVGRIMKMMTERPEGSPLDEYLRVIPSARAELRKKS